MGHIKEFAATHYWKQYPKIYFEVDEDTDQVRAKGLNDFNPTNWVAIRDDRNGVPYFRLRGETIYMWDLEKV